MYLREHDAKEVLRRSGVPVPAGHLLLDASVGQPAGDPGAGWVVKAQVPAGGRGRQGGVRMADDWAGVQREAAAMLGRRLGAHVVDAVRVETRVIEASEAYFSLSVAAAERAIRVIMSGKGGVDIEALHASGHVQTSLAPPDEASILATCRDLAHAIGDAAGEALATAASSLTSVFLHYGLLLLEINPLFVRQDGSWLAGDAKMLTDDNALDRHPDLQAMLECNQDAYEAPHLKWQNGFDYVVLDTDGEIGLVTTGAGLSMLLVDELRARGLRPYNFLDVRTGGMNGSPDRLVQVLRWIARGTRIRVVFCNIFAGATDLAEFARLLLAARAAVPELQAPLVVRLVGNGLDGAREVLATEGIDLTTELEHGIARVIDAADCSHA